MKDYNIIDFGAVSNGRLMTAAIQKAIDCCFQNGGGRVIVPTGDFHTGGIRLRSGVTLYLKENAHLIGSKNPEDYYGIRNDTLEPLPESDQSDAKWLPTDIRKNADHLNKCGSCWNNALIRAVDAENIAIIGEEGAYIDGADCFDETGEEHYRGPHAIDMHRCKNIRFFGYTVQNSANWAHAIFECENITAENVSVKGGHDGIHIRSCTNVTIRDCQFYTGDDCIAGFDNLNVIIQSCIFNTACSGMRFGGTNVIAEQCKFIGPAKYIFRGSLTDKEKRCGMTSQADESHRYNMLSAFTYISDFTRPVRELPENIIIKDCEIKNTDRFLHYNFSGNEPWQCNQPLKNITFENIRATGIRMPLTLYGSPELPVTLEMRNTEIEFAKDIGDVSFIHAAWFEKIIFNHVRVSGLTDRRIVRTWSDGGEIVCNDFEWDIDNAVIREKATEPFYSKAI